MKIMISQPMGNKTNEQIRAEREEIVQELAKRNYEVIDTIFEEEAPKGTNIPVYYLGKSIEALSKADKVLFMNGWENARGCKIEHEICLRYEIPVIYENEVRGLKGAA